MYLVQPVKDIYSFQNNDLNTAIICISGTKEGKKTEKIRKFQEKIWEKRNTILTLTGRSVKNK
jgi:hypothetical protein